MAPDQMRHSVGPDQDPNYLPKENPGQMKRKQILERNY